MKRIVPVLILVTACGGANKPPPVPTIALPSGDALKPFDPAHPTFAHPAGVAGFADKVYVALGNSDSPTFRPSGPGMLAVVVPSTANVPVIDLGGSTGKQCLSPGFVRAAGNYLYVSCTGAFGSTTGAAIVEVDPAGNGSVRRALSIGVNPNGVAVAGNRVWYGDTSSDRIFPVDLATFTSAGDPIALGCPQGSDPMSAFRYIPDVAPMGTDLYALCASDIGGKLYRVDPGTGAIKSQVSVGPIATELTSTADGRIAVVNSGDSTVMLITPTSTGLSAQVALTLPNTQNLQDIRARDHFLFTVASQTNTVQKIDLTAQGGPKVVAEANVGDGANPWNVYPLDDDQVIVSNLLTNNLVAITSTCGAGKVCWTVR
ncbi:MAG: hypothetical protein E6J82_16585 [Deltaproteobacteria bacterium]|nr:MAG: hypothetical protein E6J82_16585 [Deltaproteobacteria bacterium]TMA76580.1 MAG: hypothetical protein E6J67_04195 [Deltaproteobacteria bacterium]TMB39591.1 MAG: hypothetical protein E6J58_06695 [Deltaproteobacteria bacterium]